jgi:inosine-uridine nucleoside N-ribohydrolase
VWLGGFGDEESYRRFRMAELNGRADMAAWRVVLEEPVELLQVPGWSGPHRILVKTEPFGRELRETGRPVAEYLADILEEWVSEYESAVDVAGEKILWDLACTAAVVDPPSVEVRALKVPGLDAACAHDWREGSRGRTVEAVVDLDPERVLGGLKDAILRLPGDPGPRRSRKTG